MNLEKCYAYATMKNKEQLPDEYRVNYETITQAIEEMDCNENVRSVMRLRYGLGYKFTDISNSMGLTYQWVYELHKNGVSFLEKHMSV